MEEENLLQKYLFLGMSFSTFHFLEVDSLCLKYEKAFFKFRKKKYLKQIYENLLKSPIFANLQLEFTPYYIHKEIDAIKNASLFINPDSIEKKLVEKYRKGQIQCCQDFILNDLPENLKGKKACCIFIDMKEMNDHSSLLEKFNNSNILILSNILKENLENEIQEDLMDLIKVQILKDDSDFFFVTGQSLYVNQIINFIFGLNKIGVAI